MAESKKPNTPKSVNPFSEDLDAMLKDDDLHASQQVGMIDDDDAIDRLLMAENFPEIEEDVNNDPAMDFDASLTDEFDHNDLSNTVLDDSSTVDEDSGLEDGLELASLDEIESTDTSKYVETIDEVNNPQLSALERVEDIDEFDDEKISDDIHGEDAKAMVEIDEFSEDTVIAQRKAAEFLLTDFDISSGEVLTPNNETQSELDEFAEAIELDDDMPGLSLAMNSDVTGSQALLSETENRLSEQEMPVNTSMPDTEQVLNAVPAGIDYSVELKALSTQITVLKKQQQILKQELTEKAANEQIQTCLDTLDSLQTEQKKTKRVVDAVSNKKPVIAFVAAGVGVVGLLVGLGLGSQGLIAKSQVGELAGIIGKLQEQLNAAPTNDAADKEMLRKQLDELAVASSVTANQVAELSKNLNADSATDKSVYAGGDLGKHMAELNSQNLQIGAAIEVLEKKVSALERAKGVATASIAKHEPKKPAIVEENWAVNLIAFKQDWYAKRKAEEYSAKGVQAKVSKADSKGESWYRLSVDGFKSQYEAAGYAAKVKKSLNLDSVWVAKVAQVSGKE